MELRQDVNLPTLTKGIWIYGRHATLAALANPSRQCKRLLVTAAESNFMTNIVANLQACGRALPTLEVVERSVIDSITSRAVHQGMTVLANQLPSLTINAVLQKTLKYTRGIVIVLDQVTSLYNVGAVVRSAAAFGALAVVLQERYAPRETGALARIASGGLEKVLLVRITNLARALKTLKTVGFQVIGLEASSSTVLTHLEFSNYIALVLGSEEHGLRSLTRMCCDALVSLPVTGVIESLNVSNAAAIALYEVTRKKTFA